MSTIVQVASEAGVSTSTVSHVLNGTRHVEPETRQRVLEAIEKTSYRRDALARALRRSRTDSIGLVVSDAGEPAFAEMVHGAEHAAAALGLTLLLANSSEGHDRELNAVRVFLERRVDGLILARAAASQADLVNLVTSERTPVVLLDRVFPDLPFDQAAAENEAPMKELVRHLAARGHRRFCLVVGDTRVPSLAERLKGFRDAVAELALDESAQLVLEQSEDRALAVDLAAALRAEHGPTVYIACSTVLAAHTLEAMQALGRRAPAHVAFATFDGFSHADLFEPRVTTVRQPAFEVGAAAVQLLHERMSDHDTAPRIVRLPQRIEYRESTEGFRPST